MTSRVLSRHLRKYPGRSGTTAATRPGGRTIPGCRCPLRACAIRVAERSRRGCVASRDETSLGQGGHARAPSSHRRRDPDALPHRIRLPYRQRYRDLSKGAGARTARETASGSGLRIGFRHRENCRCDRRSNYRGPLARNTRRDNMGEMGARRGAAIRSEFLQKFPHFADDVTDARAFESFDISLINWRMKTNLSVEARFPNISDAGEFPVGLNYERYSEVLPSWIQRSKTGMFHYVTAEVYFVNCVRSENLAKGSTTRRMEMIRKARLPSWSKFNLAGVV